MDAALRLDKFSSVAGVIFSPRLALLFKPTASQSVRASFGGSYLAPTVIDNFFDLSVIGFELPLGGFGPPLAGQSFPVVVRVHGQPDLNEQSLTMWEIAYTGVFGRTTAKAAAYLGDLHDPIAGIPGQPHTSANPPPRWPLPPFLLDLVKLPSELVSTNLGPVRNRGLELSLAHGFSGGVTAFANYSWQDDPEPLEPDPGTPIYPAGSLNVPSHHRFNAGLTLDRGRLLGGITLNYMSKAFWADILGPTFWGPTPAHTLLGASVGMRLAGNRLTLMLKGENLLDEDVQYEIFGDIVKASVLLQAKVRF